MNVKGRECVHKTFQQNNVFETEEEEEEKKKRES